MSDPLRTETSRPSEPASRAEREAKIEQLLLAGLDHYFAAQYEQAINVWTRALFLDRSHARARAYIERARSAQAERQRESEALLHDGADAVRRGDRTEARRLLDAAMQRGVQSEELLALLDHVDWLDHITPAAVVDAGRHDEARLTLDVPASGRRSRVAWSTFGGLLLVIVAAGVFATGGTRTEWGALIDRATAHSGDHAAVAPSAPAGDVLLPPVPRRAESALARAHALVSSGRLRDALPLLESIRTTDPERAEADRMRADIQRQLIALGPLPAGLMPKASGDGRP